ncbi:MAG: ABC transporter permease [Bacteroidota bacterium]
MIWKTAWKNVWRNPTRSLVVILSVMIGIFGGVVAVAVMNGMIAQRVEAALKDELSNIQINKKGFRDNYDLLSVVPDNARMMHTLEEVPGVDAVCRRVVVNGMINSAAKSSGIQINGVYPDEERQVFDLCDQLIPGSGSYLDSAETDNPVYIGEDLAKDLNIIRYTINEEMIAVLREQQVPEEVLEKLRQKDGTRFINEKAFKEELGRLFTRKEAAKYGPLIRKAAWTFRPRAKVTLTFLDSANNQTGAVFRIAGLYDIKNNLFEKTQVFIAAEDLIRLSGLPEGSVHQYMVKIDDLRQTGQISEEIKKRLPGLEVMNWKELQPDLAMMSDMVQQFYAVFMVIILAALAFGIVNTMLMVVLERTRELGMLTAIGMNKKKVFRMIMLESVFLSLAGGLAGMVLSWGIIRLTASRGLDFTRYAEGFEAMGYSSHIYPEISNGFFLTVTVLIIITGILSAIYPAMKALKLDPAEAIRTE